MSLSGPNVPKKRFTVIDNTLHYEGKSSSGESVQLSITLENGTTIHRDLLTPRYERVYSSDSKLWIDSILPGGSLRKERTVHPWIVWKRAHQKVHRLAVLAATDGSGKWMLDLLTKDESEQVTKSHKQEAERPNIAKQRELREHEKQQKITKREADKQAQEARRIYRKALREEQLREAKAFMASSKTASPPPAEPSAKAIPSSTSSPTRKTSAAGHVSPSRRTSRTNSIRKASVDDGKAKSRCYSVSSSISSK